MNQEIVFYNNKDYSKAVTTTNSLLVAKKFKKRHDHILRDIEKILKDMKEIGQPKIGESSFYIKKTTYINSQNKEQPLYEFDKKFFTLLVMGFTGKEALQFKIDYINQFDLMERELLHRNDTRLIGKQIRRKLTDDIGLINDLSNNPNWKKWSFKLYSELIYKKVFGKTSTQLKQEKGIKGKSLRDHFTLEELTKVNNMEDIVDAYIWKNKLYLLKANDSYNKVKEFLQI